MRNRSKAQPRATVRVCRTTHCVCHEAQAAIEDRARMLRPVAPIWRQRPLATLERPQLAQPTFRSPHWARSTLHGVPIGEPTSSEALTTSLVPDSSCVRPSAEDGRWRPASGQSVVRTTRPSRGSVGRCSHLARANRISRGCCQAECEQQSAVVHDDCRHARRGQYEGQPRRESRGPRQSIPRVARRP